MVNGLKSLTTKQTAYYNHWPGFAGARYQSDNIAALGGRMIIDLGNVINPKDIGVKYALETLELCFVAVFVVHFARPSEIRFWLFDNS